MPGSEIDPEDVRAIMLMQVNATVESILDLLREDYGDEDEEESDS